MNRKDCGSVATLASGCGEERTAQGEMALDCFTCGSVLEVPFDGRAHIYCSARSAVRGKGRTYQ